MDISDWRKKIDELDQRLVELLNERAAAAKAIGALKRNTQMPIYEPDRERQIFEKVRKRNKGPLPDLELVQIFERIIDIMRKIQHVEIEPDPQAKAASGESEFEAEVNE
jgi:chorismate mutase-like protein